MAVSRFGLGALSRPAAASRRPALCILARVAALLPCPAAQPCALTPGVRMRGSLRVSCSATPPALLEAAPTQAAAASVEARPSAKRKLGHLHLITGPMFSGKTTELLHHVRKHESDGCKILIVKSGKDNRFSASAIVSHGGLKRDCHAVHSLALLYSLPEYASAEVVAVDEAQFFSDLKDFCTRAVDVDHKTVLVAGLDGDFRREPFGQVLHLVPLADEVTKKQGSCKRCGKLSLFSLRIVPDSRTELVGGREAYEPACRQCYTAATRAAH